MFCAQFLAAAVMAQQTPAPTTLTQRETEEIVVTGTRLPEPNMVAPSPTQVVDAEDIAVSGRSDINDLLHTMPQVFNNSLGQDLGNYTSGLTTAGGVSTVDLRGLGPHRTLVLVNGKRLGIGSPNTAIASPAPNIDLIPTPLIERVDVLTGGASAVYGSDAIAGVVNFIMKRNFEGFQVDADYGYNWDDNDNPNGVQGLNRDFGVTPDTGSVNDGDKADISVMAGVNSADGRGNVTAFLGYHKQNAVPASHRDFGQCQLNKAFAINDNGTPADDTDDFSEPPSSAFCSGSSNSNFWGPRDSGTGDGATGTGLNQTFSVLDNTFVPRGSADAPGSFGTNPATVFNAQPYIFMSRDDERYTADFTGHYDFTDVVKPYVEFGFMNDQTHQEVAPTALFRGSQVLTADNNYRINCANAFMSQQQRDIMCSPADQAADAASWAAHLADPSVAYSPVLAEMEIGRRNVEGGGREYDFEHNAYRAVLGFTGDFATAWSYDFYGQYYYVQFYQKNTKDIDLSTAADALVAQLDVNGNPVCGSEGSCVPYNPFNGNGVLQADPFAGVTAEQLDYLYTLGTVAGNDTLGTIHLDFTGRLGEYGIKLPTASDGVSVNLGYENRREHQEFAPDSASESGLIAGSGGTAAPIDASLRVREYSAEVRVPLVQEAPFVQDLNVDLAYRYSDYSSKAGGIDTYAGTIQYAPVTGMRFRGSYQKAIRAPSIIELFNPQLVGRVQVGEDPCAPGEDQSPAEASLASCLNSVDPADAAAFTAAYGDGTHPALGSPTPNVIPQGTAGQLAQLQGGNPDLEPEEADTYTLGVVVSPELLPNFRGSLDYWRIEGEKFVGALDDPNTLLSGCLGDFNTGAGSDPLACTQIIRQFTTYSLTGANPESGGYIVQTNVNIAEVDISGIDVQADYTLELPGTLGGLDFALYGSYMLEYDTTSSPGASPYDCTGLFGALCQTVNADWRHTFMTTWRTPVDGLDTTLTWRYIAGVDQDQNDCGEFPSATQHPDGSFCAYPVYGAFDSYNASIASQSYFDLAATYQMFDGALQIRGGINNILNNRPPIVTTEIISGGAANTYETYDMFGRQVFLGFTMKL
jgi:outer membrane receptor protein involved in Fe transport